MIALSHRARCDLRFLPRRAQGLASGDLDADGAGARALAAVPDVEMITVQSFSKNLGLYAERAGVVALMCVALMCPSIRPALHAYAAHLGLSCGSCQDAAIAANVGQQLRRTIRLTHSSPPQHGAAVVATILGEPERFAEWRVELKSMAERLLAMRLGLHDALVEIECPPPSGCGDGSWKRVLNQCGMFTYTGLTRSQVTALRETHHIYMPMDGRLCMAALTKESCKVLATAIKDVLLREQEEAGASTAPTAKRLRRA